MAASDTNDARAVRWRVDASTSRTVRALWALGTGTFLAVITLIVCNRLYAMAAELGGEAVVIAGFVAVVAAILALALADDLAGRLAALRRRLPGAELPARPDPTGGDASAPEGDDKNADGDGAASSPLDAAVGAIVVGAVILVLVVGVGTHPALGTAALTIPLALVAIMVSAFLQSSGYLDPDEGALYLTDPDEAIDLEVVVDVSVRRLGDGAVVSLDYATPDGQYVRGPRRLYVPTTVAAELERAVEGAGSAASGADQ